MTYRLFIDDERFPVQDNWVIVRTFDEACDVISKRGLPEFISFDHDLGAGPTGMDFARWLVEWVLEHRLEGELTGFAYDVHSQNPVGAANIRGLLDSFLEHVKGQ